MGHDESSLCSFDRESHDTQLLHRIELVYLNRRSKMMPGSLEGPGLDPPD